MRVLRPSLRPRARRAAVAAAAALPVAALLGCPRPVDPTDPGDLGGTVTIVGAPAPGVELANGEVVLSREPDAPRSAAVRIVPLAGGPRSFTFAARELPPGRYYVEACFTYPQGRGCRPYSTAASGDATAVEVRPGRSTRIVMDF
jgi:hypothetical protein